MGVCIKAHSHFFLFIFLLVILFFRIFANVKMQLLSTKNF